MAARWLPLVCAAAVLFSAEAQDSYTALSESYKKGVDLVLEQLASNNNVKLHFRFLRSLDRAEHDGGFGVTFFYHHFYLKPTWCSKGTASRDCLVRNDRPLMDCAVCYKTLNNRIESSPLPYVHCIQKPRLTEEMKRARLDYWKTLTYRVGSATIMALSTG